MRTDDLMLPHLPRMNFVVFTPYLVNPATSKKVNVGDGFIMDSALKLLGAVPKQIFSSRVLLTGEDIAAINDSKFALVAGANTLKDSLEITTGLNLQTLEKIKVPIVLCGQGHYGTREATSRGLEPESRDILREILSRFPYISVRCDASREYLVNSLPQHADQILMTSCPVAYSVDGLDFGFAEKENYDHFVCTITDRAELSRQLEMMRSLKCIVRSKRKTLALHQDYSNSDLWSYASFFGYKVFRSNKYSDFLQLYKTADLHVGNRVHAHLKCLSYGVRSVLTPFDLRHEFFAESLDFPVVRDVSQLSDHGGDFHGFLTRRSRAAVNMTKFMDAARDLLGA